MRLERRTVAVLKDVSMIKQLTTADDLGTHEGNLDSALTTREGIVESLA